MNAQSPGPAVTSRPSRVLVDPAHPEFGRLLHAANIIRHGGLVAYPTETFYGLGANPFDASAVEKVFELKGRSVRRPLILILSHPGQLFDLAQASGLAREWQEKLARAFWPGPLTMVLPARIHLNCAALAGGDTVAVRLSSHPVAWQLARTAGIPVTSTSANPSGQAPAAGADDIDPALAAQLDLVLDAGPSPGGPASTILDLTGQRPEILRQGSITADQIESVIALRPRLAPHLTGVA